MLKKENCNSCFILYLVCMVNIPYQPHNSRPSALFEQHGRVMVRGVWIGVLTPEKHTDHRTQQMGT